MSSHARRGMTRSRRVIVTLVMGVAIIVGLPPGTSAPAHAHTRTAETTNIASVVTHDPLPHGVTFTVYTGGLVVSLTNTTNDEVVVVGYEGEPYLRIGPDGVFENARSPAAWLNRARFADVAIPPSVDAAAPPQWRQRDHRPTWIWHDHRTHWMAPTAPGFVDASALQNTLIRMELVGPIGRAHDAAGTFHTWSVPVEIDGTSLAIRGELQWIDPPPARGWLAAAFVLLALAYMTPPQRRDGGITRMATVVIAVAAINGIHLVDDLIAFPGDLLDELFGLLHTTFFLTAGIAGGLWARMANSGRRLALGIGSGAVLYHQGLVHLPMLYASQFPTVWPDGLIRLTVALGLLQAAFTVMTLWRTRTSQRPGAVTARARNHEQHADGLGSVRSPSSATRVHTSRGSR